MKSINILITAVGGDIGANIINILREQKLINFNIIGTDINKNVFIQDDLNMFYQVPQVKSKEYKNKILKIITTYDIKVLIPVSENEILWFNQNICVFKDLNVKILINNQNIINKFLDKYQTSLALNNLNINTPKTILFDKYNNELNFPIIIKSNKSIYSKKIHKVCSKEELDFLQISMNNKEYFIVQEYIGTIDEEYTSTVYRSNDTLKIITFKRSLTGGMTSKAEIINIEILNNYLKSIAESFNLQGSINIQSRKENGKFYIFEINPRLSSTIYIRNHFNFKDLLWWINDSLELDIIDNRINIEKIGSALLGYKYKFYKQ